MTSICIDDIKAHIKKNWPNASQDFFSWEKGGIKQSNPNFQVCRVSPSIDNQSWVYTSIGSSYYLNDTQEHLEFSILAPKDDPIHIETLAMVTHYHSNPAFRLKLGSVVEIGQGWVDGSKCDHLLVSLPYFKGPQFENCYIDNHLIRMLWLVPITKQEFDYMKKNGQEALESIFEDKKIRITDPFRESAI